ncbi:MAG: preprotein translocase subunit SecA [Candidatus Levybacteria bacterium]|nr:preprotein translocase subunit SecA [Candidatus Levybacteria bacterium]
MSFLTKIFGDPNAKAVKEMDPLVQKINSLEPDFVRLTTGELRAKTEEFRARLEKGETLDNLLPEAFAAVREASKRTLGQRHYDVQLAGGITLHRGQIAEMRTGEGKTLTSTLPLYLNALAGLGVHLVTVNDYLAERDAVWMGQIYHALGLSVGIIQHQGTTFIYDPEYGGHAAPEDEGTPRDESRDTTGSFKVEKTYLRPAERAAAYACDITYGTNNEFGFDYLRDNMVGRLGEMVQRGHLYAIVDEVDSILVDEARTPLIISGAAAEAAELYYQFARLTRQLKKEEDYQVDEKLRSAILTDAGIKKMEQWLGVGNIYTDAGIRTVHHIDEALRAETLYQKDKQYVVESDEVIIVDEFTGRKMPGRRYSEGLHQAIEAKENVKIQRESQTLATVTFQNYFRMYKKLGGMTGTAVTEAEEFGKIYKLEVVVMPTNRIDQRIDHPDRIYSSESAKFAAVVRHIKELHERGQPVLLGTISIEKNEELGLLLEREGIPFQMLNAKNHEREAEVIAQAGRAGAVTLATNMAGRGVDIVLGGNPQDKDEAARVRELGGLFVLGTERHESRRIDNQLRGRAGRQGDPGATQFYVSVEDDLMRIFAGDRIKSMMTRLRVPEDVPIEAKMVSKAIETAQKKVEGHNFDIRKHLLDYDDVLNKHRETIYRRRREMLELAENKLEVTSEGFSSLKDIILDMVRGEIAEIVNAHATPDADWDIDAITAAVQKIYPISKEHLEKLREFGTTQSEDAAGQAIELLADGARAIYADMEKHVENADFLHEMEKALLVRTLDVLWIDHLVAIDRLRAGIGLRGYAQQDPLVAYKKETYYLYQNLLSAVQHDVAHTVFKVGTAAVVAPSLLEQEGLIMQGSLTGRASAGSGAVKEEGGENVPSPSRGEGQGEGAIKIGRNDPCFCGSGKKYKKCHYPN